MEITVNPNALNDSQRKYVADFILNFPASEQKPLTIPVRVDTSELEKLAHDMDSTMPEAAFGVPASVAEAFGTPPLPPAAVAPAPAPAAVPAAVVPPPPPSAPAAAATGIPAAIELDVHGLPWDRRIHSREKSKVADGSWRRKRGTDEAEIARIEAELRATLAGSPAPTAPALAANAPTVTIGVPPAPAPAAIPSPTEQFAALMGEVASAIAAGKTNYEEMAAICQKHGVANLPLLPLRPDLMPTVIGEIRAHIASKG